MLPSRSLAGGENAANFLNGLCWSETEGEGDPSVFIAQQSSNTARGGE